MIGKMSKRRLNEDQIKSQPKIRTFFERQPLDSRYGLSLFIIVYMAFRAVSETATFQGRQRLFVRRVGVSWSNCVRRVEGPR